MHREELVVEEVPDGKLEQEGRVLRARTHLSGPDWRELVEDRVWERFPVHTGRQGVDQDVAHKLRNQLLQPRPALQDLLVRRERVAAVPTMTTVPAAPPTPAAASSSTSGSWVWRAVAAVAALVAWGVWGTVVARWPRRRVDVHRPALPAVRRDFRCLPART